jgi:hypothetical protein
LTSSVVGYHPNARGQPSSHCVARGPFAPAAAAPQVRFKNPARGDRSVRLEALARDDETELVESAERGLVGAGERIYALVDGSVRHVEVFQDERVSAFTSGDLDVYLGTTTPARPICEESLSSGFN